MPGGIKGTVDFTGYSSGVAVVAPAAGFRGLLDGIGYSVGLAASADDTPPLRTMMGMGR